MEAQTREVADGDKVAPYHSTDPTDPRVHHDYSDCPNGQQIAPKNRAPGEGGLPRCGSCERLDGYFALVDAALYPPARLVRATAVQ